MPSQPIEFPSDGAEYIWYWKRALGALLGWSEQQVEEWAQQFAADMTGPDVMFYTMGPAEYILDFLIPAPAAGGPTGERLLTLEGKVLDAIQGTEDRYYAQDFDFVEARGKVIEILREYGYSLPPRGGASGETT